jgi:signal transduction histidine kinase
MTVTSTDPEGQTETLRRRLAEAEEMLHAIRHGEIDALVVEGEDGSRVYTLHSAEEPYRNLVEQMQEGAAVLTTAGTILYANARFAALVDEPLESVVGSRVDRFVNASNRHDFDRLLGAGSGRCRSRLIGAGSGTLEVSLSLTTTASVGGERLNLIVTDLSELLSANTNRDRAERDSRSKDDFLATLAHELRTPLGAIGSAVRALESPEFAAEMSTRTHLFIERQVRHISHLVDDLLDVERVVSGKVRLNCQPIDLAETVRHIVATFGDSGKNRTIEIDVESVWANCDAVRLDQVVINLMANAVKYTPSGGRITV